MSKAIKLSEKELKTLRSYQQNQNQITFNLGNVDIQKAILEGQRSVILENLANLQEKSNKTAKDLQDKYGEGNIDLETGEFTLTEQFFEKGFNNFNILNENLKSVVGLFLPKSLFKKCLTSFTNAGDDLIFGDIFFPR